MSKNYYDHYDPIPRVNEEFADEFAADENDEEIDEDVDKVHKEVFTPIDGSVPVVRKKALKKQKK